MVEPPRVFGPGPECRKRSSLAHFASTREPGRNGSKAAENPTRRPVLTWQSSPRIVRRCWRHWHPELHKNRRCRGGFRGRDPSVAGMANRKRGFVMAVGIGAGVACRPGRSNYGAPILPLPTGFRSRRVLRLTLASGACEPRHVQTANAITDTANHSYEEQAALAPAGIGAGLAGAACQLFRRGYRFPQTIHDSAALRL